MKLLTQNFMKCEAKECADPAIEHEEGKGPYPLKVVVETSEEEKVEDEFFSRDARLKMVSHFKQNTHFICKLYELIKSATK